MNNGPTVSYIVYDKDTGEIVRYGHCPEKLVAKQARGKKETTMKAFARDEESKVDVNKETPEIVSKEKS